MNLISRKVNRSGLRISHSKVFSSVHLIVRKLIFNCYVHLIVLILIFNCSELGTLEWINFNPDFLIRISTVETFHFSP